MSKKNANIAIINSCAVTKTAISKSNRMINLAKKENPKAKIILAGCWPQVYKNEIERQIDMIWKVGDFEKLISNIFELLKVKIPAKSKVVYINSEKSRYFLKIQDGCEQFCTYCVIPYTRGKLKSKPVDDVVAELKMAIEHGYEEIVLTGIHLGLYGKDLENIDLFKLLNKLIKVNGLGRLRLSSIEITEITEKIAKLMSNTDKICQHLHIPIQSGCNKILKLMNRPYSTEYFVKRIKNIRQLMPEIAISTDVIVGFPGETDSDFEETLKFVKKIKFSRLHVFPFSAHEKTPAYRMPYQVNSNEKLSRAGELRKLGNVLAEEYRQKFKNKIAKVCVERKKYQKFIGKTEYYFDVLFDNKNALEKIPSKPIGKLIKIKI